ncbi:hypothetical protein N0V90_003205 [Kalmusia sp. IMI 367209]|nr:hypothetical protein N0V90_003205 [Kalmusia sp. IMI 367209]
MATTTNQASGATGLTTPPPTPPANTASKVDILTNVFSLATAFATCVEAFNLIHPHKDSNPAQKVALAKLGIQQGRLLIFGDAVGISSPPATIARHMVPSHPGLTNPDPTLPVNFALRDSRLDEEGVRTKVAAALEEIAGRPINLSREQLMERYGLKQPRRFSAIEHPALDTNRLEAFREKYALLQDLIRQSGIRTNFRRSGSMTSNHWTVKDVTRFDAFVHTVRVEVDGLITLMGVKEQVDRGMRTDIKAMAWHPDLSSMVVRKDWEKLRLIREAVTSDYPEYVDVADRAIKYIVEELRETKVHMLRAAQPPPPPPQASNGAKANEQPAGARKEKRPGFWSRFSHKSSKAQKERSLSVVSAPEEDPQRSLSESMSGTEDPNALTPVRSKSLSAMPDDRPPFESLDAKLQTLSVQDENKPSANVEATLVQVPTHSTADDEDIDPLDKGYGLVHADTANSLIDRHDMYRGVGRIETRDIRDKSKEAAGW